MSRLSIANRYSKALLEITNNNKTKIEKYLTDLTSIAEYIEESQDLSFVILEPRIKQKDRLSIMIQLMSKLKIEKTIQDLIKLLIMKNRIEIISEIAQTFEKLAFEVLQTARIYIETAIKINLAEKKNIISKMEQITSKKIIANFHINSSLLGGMVIRIGSLEIYGSILNQFKKIQQLII